jgi:hypothetical protein
MNKLKIARLARRVEEIAAKVHRLSAVCDYPTKAFELRGELDPLRHAINELESELNNHKP